MMHSIREPKKNEFVAYEKLQSLIRLHRPDFDLSQELSSIVYDDEKNEALLFHPTSMDAREDERLRDIRYCSIFTAKGMCKFGYMPVRWDLERKIQQTKIFLRHAPEHDSELTEFLSDSMNNEFIRTFSELNMFKFGYYISVSEERN